MRHRHRTLEKAGIVLMVAGAVAVLLPAPPADALADVHEIVQLLSRHYWWQFGGMVALVLGNTLRLIGLQGHPGLPWPLLPRGIPPEVAALLALRRRAMENRRLALAAASAS
jgi:hypothetical protein